MEKQLLALFIEPLAKLRSDL